MAMVLVVEDNREMQNLIRVLLEMEGFEMTVAGDGKVANAWIDINRPSIVLLDWMLPDMNGAQVAEHIRSVHGADVPIILFTADANSVEKAEKIGAAAAITKPFTIEELTGKIHETLSGK